MDLTLTIPYVLILTLSLIMFIGIIANSEKFLVV